MVHYMANRSRFYNLPADFVSVTPKPEMLKNSFLAQTFHSLCLRKVLNFTATFINQ